MAHNTLPKPEEFEASQILPWLWLGNYESACNLSHLKQMNITSILNVTDNCKNLFEKDLHYFTIQVEDDSDIEISDAFDIAHSFLHKAFKRFQDKQEACLVHCEMGISRSSTIVISWLMKDQKISLRSAMEQVKKLRPRIKPNYGFFCSLIGLCELNNPIIITTRIGLDFHFHSRSNTFKSGKIDYDQELFQKKSVKKNETLDAVFDPTTRQTVYKWTDWNY